MTNPIIEAFKAGNIFSFEGKNAIRFRNGQYIRLGGNVEDSRKLVMQAKAWLESGSAEANAAKERVAAWMASDNFALPDGI